jgi:hypothetical protein
MNFVVSVVTPAGHASKVEGCNKIFTVVGRREPLVTRTSFRVSDSQRYPKNRSAIIYSQDDGSHIFEPHCSAVRVFSHPYATELGHSLLSALSRNS